MCTGICEDCVVQANPRVVSCELGSEIALLDLEASKYYGLNKVGASVWGLVQQPITVSNLCDRIVDRFEVDRPRCVNDVAALLQRLADVDLVRISHENVR